MILLPSFRVAIGSCKVYSSVIKELTFQTEQQALEYFKEYCELEYFEEHRSGFELVSNVLILKDLFGDFYLGTYNNENLSTSYLRLAYLLKAFKRMGVVGFKMQSGLSNYIETVELAHVVDATIVTTPSVSFMWKESL